MAKFLVLARPVKPLPEGANLKGVIAHLEALVERQQAEVHTIVEDDGYGFAILVDVESHDELMAILFENPLGRWGEYQVMPLGTMEGEYQAMRKAGVI
jgi:hypothetical protein